MWSGWSLGYVLLQNSADVFEFEGETVCVVILYCVFVFLAGILICVLFPLFLARFDT